VTLKVFRTYTNYSVLADDKMNGMEMISKAVQEWYDSGCANMDLENVFVGNPGMAYTARPKHEKL